MRKYPIFYFTDGVAVFHGRRVDEVASQFIATSQIPPVILVGIDNGGSTRESKNPGSDRANEYLPYPDAFLAPPLANPHGKLFPEFLDREVRPLVESRYRSNGQIGLAGSSYGALIALYTVLKRPDGSRWLLLESPSLYVNNDSVLKMSDEQKKWPSRIYVGAGTDEGEGDAKDEMVRDVNRLKKSIGHRAAVCSYIVAGARHNEGAWHIRLPLALKFLLGNAPCAAASSPAH